MESEFDLIDLVADVCERLGLPYAIGGSMAAMTYGEFRATNDLDLVLSLRAEDVPGFLAEFPRSDFYHDQTAALEAVRTGGQFNVILFNEALKIDVHLAADPIARQQIENARRLRSPSGRLANFSPPEELILKKLEYYHVSGSERQLRDIGTMLRLGGGDIDEARVDALARRHGLETAWEAVMKRLGRG